MDSVDLTGQSCRTIGVFLMTEGERAPDGTFRQCRVQATRSGKIVLAPIDAAESIGAIIRTVTVQQLVQILDIFYAVDTASEKVP